MLVDELYESFKEAIMDLAVAPGGKLIIDQLARDHGVSATPVREALARLEAEGLLERRALYGYRVVPLLDDQKLSDLMNVRLLLEPPAAAMAAGLIGPEALSALEESVEQTRKIATLVTGDQSYSTYRDFATQDAHFHDTIAAEAGNQVLRNILFGLHTHLHLYRLHFVREYAPPAADEHAAILAALRDRDDTAASAAMAHHMQQALARLLPIARDVQPS